MSLTTQIDVYCERTDFTFWSEPLNAVSNIAFLISAVFCYRLYRSMRPANDIYAILMMSALIITGIGSFLFHTFATRWAGLADIIPIMMMVLTYHVATMHKIAGFRIYIAAISVVIIPILSFLLSAILPDTLGATKSYAPVIILFITYSIIHIRKNNEEKFLLPLATIVFGVSLSMRALDGIICDDFAYGVHYFWHILNAVTLYLAFRAYQLNSINEKN